MMDRLAKWAIAGSLAWLVMAIGVILGTHGGAQLGARAIEAEVSPAPSWTVMPAKSADADLTFHEFTRC